MTVPEGFPKLKGEARPWVCKKGYDPCTRKHPCRSCLGARSRRSGMAKQRAARKVLESVSGAIAAMFVGQLGNEEAWHGLPVRVEVKSGAQVGPIWTRFYGAETQSLATRAIGDTRPFVFVAMPAGVTDGLMVVRLSELAAFVEAMTE